MIKGRTHLNSLYLLKWKALSHAYSDFVFCPRFLQPRSTGPSEPPYIQLLNRHLSGAILPPSALLLLPLEEKMREAVVTTLSSSYGCANSSDFLVHGMYVCLQGGVFFFSSSTAASVFGYPHAYVLKVWVRVQRCKDDYWHFAPTLKRTRPNQVPLVNPHHVSSDWDECTVCMFVRWMHSGGMRSCWGHGRDGDTSGIMLTARVGEALQCRHKRNRSLGCCFWFFFFCTAGILLLSSADSASPWQPPVMLSSSGYLSKGDPPFFPILLLPLLL